MLKDGRLRQCASPRELVSGPVTSFVGSSVLQCNVLPAWWQGCVLHTLLGPTQSVNESTSLTLPVASDVSLEGLASPDDLDLCPGNGGVTIIVGRQFLGRYWLDQVGQGGIRLRVRLPIDTSLPLGQRCGLHLRPVAVVHTCPARKCSGAHSLPD